MCQNYICRPNWSFADVVSIYILQALHYEVTNEAASWALWAVAGLGSKKRLRQLLPKYLGTAAVGSLYSSDTIWSTLERLACWHQSFEACRLRSSVSNSAPGRAVFEYVLFFKLCEFITNGVVNALFVWNFSFVVNVLLYTWYSKCRTIGHGTPLDLNDYFLMDHDWDMLDCLLMSKKMMLMRLLLWQKVKRRGFWCQRKGGAKKGGSWRRLKGKPHKLATSWWGDQITMIQRDANIGYNKELYKAA